MRALTAAAATEGRGIGYRPGQNLGATGERGRAGGQSDSSAGGGGAFFSNLPVRGLSPVTLVLNTVIRAVVDCGEINKYHTTADAAATAYGVQAREAPRRARATGAGESGTVCVFFALASGSWVWLCLRV